MELEKYEKAGRVTGDFVSSGPCLSASFGLFWIDADFTT